MTDEVDDMAIRSASPERVPVISGMFARALIGDPMANAGLRGGLHTMGIQMHIIAGAYAAAGMLWEAVEPDGEMLGAAAVLEPGRREVVDSMDADFVAHADELTTDGAEANTAFWKWVWGHIPEEPHWFLDVIAVDPEHQGRGVGSALARFVMRRAAADGLPLLLDTGLERNVAFYRGLGFEVMADGDAPGGAPHVWFMRADPLLPYGPC